MRIILSVLMLLSLAVISMCAEGEDRGEEVQDITGVLRDLREAADSHNRLKRACTWWFQWKVTGAQVDTAAVTQQLDDLFRQVCNTYGK